MQHHGERATTEGIQMTANELIGRLNAALDAFGNKRTPSGHLLPGILRLSRPILDEFRKCTKADWEAQGWTISEKDLTAIQHGSEDEAYGALKRLVTHAGVPVSGWDVVDGEELAIIAELEQEIKTFLRELPGWLQGGKEGKHVLIQGDQVVGFFDTFDEGYEAGIDQFGVGKSFAVQPIDPKFLVFL